MKFIIKTTFLTILLLIAFLMNCSGQQKFLVKYASIGGTLSFDSDDGKGMFFGFNPALRVSEFVYVEGQLSYMQLHKEQYGFNERKRISNVFNSLLGFRLYLTPEYIDGRIYFNILAGNSFQHFKEIGGPSGKLNDSGFTIGLFIEHHRVVVGLTGEPPRNIVLKGGITF
ncbi:MAG: hypothetical protein AB8F74_07900 [Saprospiraceae bacterium]